MADLTVTAAEVGRPHPETDEVYTMLAAAAITEGQAVYQDTNGKVNVADANVAAADQFRGIALNAGAAGDPIAVLIRGFVSGFDVSGVNADTFAYLSDTAGALADAAGTLEVRVGRVMGTGELDTSGNVIQMIYIDSRLTTDWA